MKKTSLLLLALITLLFTQCKPEPDELNNDDNSNKVRVSCVIPINNSNRSDFTNLMTDGSVNWSDGRECIYLAIPGETPKIVELESYSEGYQKSLEFTAYVNENLLTSGTSYEIWYFGNSQELDAPYFNLSNNNKIEGSIAKQSGRLSDLGYCHIASTTVTAITEDGEVRLPLEGTLKNKMAIALLDLNNVSSLSGDAIIGTSYSLEYNSTSKKYEFKVVEDIDASISVESASGISYVVLLPNEINDVALQCERNSLHYEYIFKNGIKANKAYYRAEQSGDVSYLPWTEYDVPGNEGGGDEGGNEEHVDDNIVFAKGVTRTSGWYDVNKVGNGTVNGDINMCWAASAANILQWWQDRYVEAGNTLPEGCPDGPGTTYELEIMEIFHDEWNNEKGGHFFHAAPWYFEGKNVCEGWTSQAQPLTGGGFFKNEWNNISQNLYMGYQYGYTQDYNNYYNWGSGTGLDATGRLKAFSDFVISFIEKGMTSLVIAQRENLGGTHHSVTLWGYEKDDATGLITKIYITDSDDSTQWPREAKLHEYTVSSASNGGIKFSGDVYPACYPVALYPISGYGSN